jgi:hypothetical protein
LQILGHSNFALTSEERGRAHLELLDHLTAGRIVLDVEPFAFDDIAAAWAAQASGRKAVVNF